ncbi:MAG TPA: aminoacyl-tRNA hydrolase [Desulfurobacteriaceae bacterium]|nr:aminoacyl-tRNA hydrolase [Desulfurobacteriaceae bacterium]
MTYLFVGLGNPGEKYQNTRHNFGFMVLDYFAKKFNLEFVPKFKGLISYWNDNYFLKPMTFMNYSGESVKEAKNNLKISEENIIVIHDDLDLKLGDIRIKKGGSNAGHHGLDSISKLVGNNYWRIRLGIGRPIDKKEVINFVLSPFDKKEMEIVRKVIRVTAEKILEIIQTGEVKNERILL